jgi:hypothetical protein
VPAGREREADGSRGGVGGEADGGEEAKPDAVPMRWTWDDNNPTALIICIVMWMIVIGSIVAVVLYFIGTGSLPSITVPMLRGLLVFAIAAIAWCHAFVRRVPR